MSYNTTEKKEDRLFSLKSGKEAAIPAPVSTSTPRVSSSRRWKLVFLAVASAVLFNVLSKSFVALSYFQSTDAQLDDIDYSVFDYSVYFAYDSNNTGKPHSKHPRSPFLNGKLAEKFKTGRLLGKGGFAICYEGELKSKEKRSIRKALFALKIVRSKMSQKKMEEKVRGNERAAVEPVTDEFTVPHRAPDSCQNEAP